MTAVPPRPAAPDATAGDELREALVRPIRELADAYGRWPFRVDPLKVTRRLDLLADAVLALPALRDVLAERDRLRAALRLIDRNGCENLTRSRCSGDPARTRDSDYTSTQWCPTCIAADALDGTT